MMHGSILKNPGKLLPVELPEFFVFVSARFRYVIIIHFQQRFKTILKHGRKERGQQQGAPAPVRVLESIAGNTLH